MTAMYWSCVSTALESMMKNSDEKQLFIVLEASFSLSLSLSLSEFNQSYINVIYCKSVTLLNFAHNGCV